MAQPLAIRNGYADRYVPATPEAVQKLAWDTRLFIFNVGPWTLRREMGSSGTALIPACPEGAEYSKPYIVLGVEQEPYPVDETQCAMIPKSGPPGQKGGAADGIYLAQQILGEGAHLARSASFRPFGVFISKTEIPSKEDLRAARAALHERLQYLVKEANDSWAQDRDKMQVIQKDWHQRAAELLKKGTAECPWMGDRTVGAERIDCPFCAVAIPSTVAKCPNCKEVVNQELYKQAQARARNTAN
jgi:hypothetical protein